VYTPDDDVVIEEWLRQTVGTTWHSMGTCKMALRGGGDEGAVVDERLAVYGVEGLRIADLSIAAGNVAANTCSLALVVGERAAEIFIEGLQD
jgi:choline dehydrogenase-like flavoprotein